MKGSWSNGTTPPWRGGNPSSTLGGSTDIRKVAGYGLPGRTANACHLKGDEGSNPLPSAYGSMRKRTSCLASNERFQVQIPSVTPRCRRGSTEKGSALVKRPMLVRIQSSALISRWCNGQHRTLLRSWFDSRSGYWRLFRKLLRKEGVPCLNNTSTNNHFFETMSKRRKGFLSETQVKRDHYF